MSKRGAIPARNNPRIPVIAFPLMSSWQGLHPKLPVSPVAQWGSRWQVSKAEGDWFESHDVRFLFHRFSAEGNIIELYNTTACA